MQPVYLRMTLSPQLGMSEITTLWHFKPPLLILTFTSAASFPRLLEIGTHLQILSFLLLKEQKTLLLSSLPPIRHVRNHHSLAFQIPFANTDIYKCSFFPQTIRDWNSLTDTFLSAAEGANDSVAKFTFLVRARD